MRFHWLDVSASRPCGQRLESLLKSMGGKSLVPFLVVKWIIGVKPITLGIYVQSGDLGRIRRLYEHLLLGNQVRDKFNFVIVEMELLLVQVPVHVWIRQKDLGNAALQNDIEDLGLPQFVERLGREHQRSVVFAPGLEGFNDIGTDARVFQKKPGLVD